MFARLMRAPARPAWLAFGLAAALLAGMPHGWAADATTLDTDPNNDGLGFGLTDAFTFGGRYNQDNAATLNGNDVLAQRQVFNADAGGAGAGISVPVSNGENGLDQSLDGAFDEIVNADVPNATPANSVFATIGNASSKLENGNVVRYSMWVRSNPNNPVTLAPQIEPVLKFEFWKEALSTNADTSGGVPQPGYGDKVVDTDQHLGDGIWIDLNNDGFAIDGNAAAEGRLRTISTTAWTLIETQYTVNDTEWLGIGNDLYTVSQVEEVRGVMFWGDFAGTDFSADGDDGGQLLFDNIKMEVFKDLAAVTPNSSPNPDAAPSRAGDFDGDGDVDGQDLARWKTAYGLTALGDGDDDNDSDGNDFLIWQRDLGPAAGVGAVPEPGSAALALVGLAALAGIKRRRVG
jgi:hypothetical protein